MRRDTTAVKTIVDVICRGVERTAIETTEPQSIKIDHGVVYFDTRGSAVRYHRLLLPPPSGVVNNMIPNGTPLCLYILNNLRVDSSKDL